RETAENGGVIGLPVSVVALADHRTGKRIEKSRPPRSRAFVEKPRILLEEREQDGAADKRAGNGIGVSSAQAFAVALRPLSVSAEGIRRLLNSGNNRGHPKVHGINGELPSQLKFLPRVERNGGRIVSDIEIGNHSKDALFLFIFDFGFRYFDRSHGNSHLARRRGQAQRDGRHGVVFARVQSSGSTLRRETRRGNRELERSRRNAGEGELPVAVRRGLLT